MRSAALLTSECSLALSDRESAFARIGASPVQHHARDLSRRPRPEYQRPLPLAFGRAWEGLAATALAPDDGVAHRDAWPSKGRFNSATS
jgi:hypothetical protein